MRILFLIILFFTAFAATSGQAQTKVSAAALVKIVETADYLALTKLVKNLGYFVADSSKAADGSLFYITKELKVDGNTLGCHADSKLKIKQLTFSTYSMEVYKGFKTEIKALNFTSSGLSKRNTGEITEAEDFEKGKIYIGSSAEKEGDLILYTFTFFRF